MGGKPEVPAGLVGNLVMTELAMLLDTPTLEIPGTCVLIVVTPGTVPLEVPESGNEVPGSVFNTTVVPPGVSFTGLPPTPCPN